jgi:hypothetical protein
VSPKTQVLRTELRILHIDQARTHGEAEGEGAAGGLEDDVNRYHGQPLESRSQHRKVKGANRRQRHSKIRRQEDQVNSDPSSIIEIFVDGLRVWHGPVTLHHFFSVAQEDSRRRGNLTRNAADFPSTIGGQNAYIEECSHRFNHGMDPQGFDLLTHTSVRLSQACPAVFDVSSMRPTGVSWRPGLCSWHFQSSIGNTGCRGLGEAPPSSQQSLPGGLAGGCSTSDYHQHFEGLDPHAESFRRFSALNSGLQQVQSSSAD